MNFRRALKPEDIIVCSGNAETFCTTLNNSGYIKAKVKLLSECDSSWKFVVLDITKIYLEVKF